jgi:hypothetical protein
MKTLKTIILSVGAVALFGASGLYAQTKATAKIPFDFSAQNTALPAGEYTMSKLSTSRDTLVIENVGTRETILVLAPENVSEYKAGAEKSVILFHKVGDRYFLAEVNTAAVRGHVGPSKVERELASEGSQPMAAVIVSALSVR